MRNDFCDKQTWVQLGCASTLSLALWAAAGDRAAAEPKPTPAIAAPPVEFVSPTALEATPSDLTPSDALSLKSSAKLRLRALERFGCACTGCQELVRRLERQGS